MSIWWNENRVLRIPFKQCTGMFLKRDSFSDSIEWMKRVRERENDWKWIGKTCPIPIYDQSVFILLCFSFLLLNCRRLAGADFTAVKSYTSARSNKHSIATISKAIVVFEYFIVIFSFFHDYNSKLLVCVHSSKGFSNIFEQGFFPSLSLSSYSHWLVQPAATSTNSNLFFQASR